MNLSVEIVNDVTVVTLAGEYLDASNTQQFKQDMTAIIQETKKLVLDLSAVQFVDSSGCGAILTCLRLLHAAGGELRLCGPSRQVRALFELVRMHKLVDILENRIEAVTAFTQSDPGETGKTGASGAP